MRVMVTALCLAACGSKDAPPAPRPPPVAPVVARNAVELPIGDGDDPHYRRVVLIPGPSDVDNAIISVRYLGGIDTLARPLPACIEVPPYTGLITVEARDLGRVDLAWENTPDFERVCRKARALLQPPALRGDD